MFAEQKTKKAQTATTTSFQTKLHTVHALLREQVFVGQFQAQGKTYDYSFVPTRVSLVENRLVMGGRFSVKSQLGLRTSENVEARLVATQGAMGVSPIRRQLLTGTAQTAQTATSDQKLEQEKGPETDIQPGLHAFDSPRRDELGRPIVESTGTLAFVGVLYFHLSPLSGQALGVPLDMSRVQLGARLAPTDETARDLQMLFSDLVMALGKDSETANSCIENINRIFKE